MTPQKHIVKQLVLDIELETATNPGKVHFQMGQLVKNNLQGQLSDLFDSFSAPGEIIRIDRLTLDLGTIDETESDQAMMGLIKEKLQLQLAEIQQAAVLQRSAAGSPDSQINRSGTAPTTDSITARNAELLIYFLETGNFPWWAGVANETAFWEKVEAILAPGNNTRIVQELKRILQNEQVRKRLFWQFPLSQVERIMIAVYPGLFSVHHSELDALIGFMGEKTQINAELMKRAAWSGFFRFWVSNRETSKNDSFLAEALLQTLSETSLISREQLVRLFTDEPGAAKERSALSGKNPARITLADRFIKQLLRMQATQGITPATESKKNSRETGNETDPGKKKAGDRNIDKYAAANLPEVEKRIRKERKPGEPFSENESERPKLPKDLVGKGSISSDPVPATKAGKETTEYYTPFAGVVMIAPFLKAFFGSIGLLDGKQFAGPAAQNRALCLLNYLSGGGQEELEAFQSLNKLLCGIDMEEAIPLPLMLSEAEKQEADGLLSQVIRNWPLLKNTSPEGFRNSFLKRSGKLSLTDNGWLLQIEQQSVDIILDTVPWGFRMIKLPWMDKILHVEW